MDPVGFSSSLNTFTGLVGAALQISLFLLEFSQDIGGASDDIEKLVKDIRTFAGIAKVGYCSLKSYSESQPTSV